MVTRRLFARGGGSARSADNASTSMRRPLKPAKHSRPGSRARSDGVIRPSLPRSRSSSGPINHRQLLMRLRAGVSSFFADLDRASKDRNASVHEPQVSTIADIGADLTCRYRSPIRTRPRICLKGQAGRGRGVDAISAVVPLAILASPFNHHALGGNRRLLSTSCRKRTERPSHTDRRMGQSLP